MVAVYLFQTDCERFSCTWMEGDFGIHTVWTEATWPFLSLVCRMPHDCGCYFSSEATHNPNKTKQKAEVKTLTFCCGNLLPLHIFSGYVPEDLFPVTLPSVLNQRRTYTDEDAGGSCGCIRISFSLSLSQIPTNSEAYNNTHSFSLRCAAGLD